MTKAATTSQKKIAKLILDRWKGNLSTSDRTMDSVSDNFDALVHELRLADTPFELAEQTLQEAILEHYPASHIAKIVHKNMKMLRKTDKDYNEFIKEWKNAISNSGKSVFYSYYNLPSDEQAAQNTKSYNGMDEKDYRSYRRYVDSFPSINLDEIDAKIAQKMESMEAEAISPTEGGSDE